MKKFCASCLFWRKINTTGKHATSDICPCLNDDLSFEIPFSIDSFKGKSINIVIPDSSGNEHRENNTFDCAEGVCIKRIIYINSTNETCKNYKATDQYHYNSKLLYISGKKSISTEYQAGSISRLSLLNRYIEVNHRSSFCAFCKYWWETPDGILEKLPVTIPYLQKNTDALLLVKAPGYCLYNDLMRIHSDDRSCCNFARSFDSTHGANTDLQNCIPFISDKQRYINSRKLVNAFFFIEFYYTLGVINEINQNAGSMDKKSKQRAKGIVNSIMKNSGVYSDSFFSDISTAVYKKATTVSPDIIRSVFFKKKKLKAAPYNPNIFWDFHNYFGITWEDIYGMRSNIGSLSIYNLSAFRVRTDISVMKKFHTKIKLKPLQFLRIIFAENIVSYFSKLLYICNDSDLKGIIDYFEREIKKNKNNRQKKKSQMMMKMRLSPDSSILSHNLDTIRRGNSYRILSVATGITEKNLENYFSGRSKPSFNTLCNISFATGFPVEEIMDTTVKKKELLNPFHHLDDTQFQELQKNDPYMKISYIGGILLNMYLYNKGFACKFAILYKELGIEKIKKKIIPHLDEFLKTHYPDKYKIIFGAEMIDY